MDGYGVYVPSARRSDRHRQKKAHKLTQSTLLVCESSCFCWCFVCVIINKVWSLFPKNVFPLFSRFRFLTDLRLS
jgi:uncharacterized protein with PQ loop repeat